MPKAGTPENISTWWDDVDSQQSQWDNEGSRGKILQGGSFAYSGEEHGEVGQQLIIKRLERAMENKETVCQLCIRGQLVFTECKGNAKINAKGMRTKAFHSSNKNVKKGK